MSSLKRSGRKKRKEKKKVVDYYSYPNERR